MSKSDKLSWMLAVILCVVIPLDVGGTVGTKKSRKIKFR